MSKQAPVTVSGTEVDRIVLEQMWLMGLRVGVFFIHFTNFPGSMEKVFRYYLFKKCLSCFLLVLFPSA